MEARLLASPAAPRSFGRGGQRKGRGSEGEEGKLEGFLRPSLLIRVCRVERIHRPILNGAGGTRTHKAAKPYTFSKRAPDPAGSTPVFLRYTECRVMDSNHAPEGNGFTDRPLIPISVCTRLKYPAQDSNLDAPDFETGGFACFAQRGLNARGGSRTLRLSGLNRAALPDLPTRA